MIKKIYIGDCEMRFCVKLWFNTLTPTPFPLQGKGLKQSRFYSFVRSFWAGVYSCRRTRNAASKNTPLPNDWHIQCKHTSSLHFGSRWFCAKNPLCLLLEELSATLTEVNSFRRRVRRKDQGKKSFSRNFFCYFITDWQKRSF